MPGMYEEDEYDLAGFAVGVVEKSEIITGQDIEVDDVIIGLPSSGIYSNGYSLVRKIIEDLSLDERYVGLTVTLGEIVLMLTEIDTKQVVDVESNIDVKDI